MNKALISDQLQIVPFRRYGKHVKGQLEFFNTDISLFQHVVTFLPSIAKPYELCTLLWPRIKV